MLSSFVPAGWQPMTVTPRSRGTEMFGIRGPSVINGQSGQPAQASPVAILNEKFPGYIQMIRFEEIRLVIFIISFMYMYVCQALYLVFSREQTFKSIRLHCL